MASREILIVEKNLISLEQVYRNNIWPRKWKRIPGRIKAIRLVD